MIQRVQSVYLSCALIILIIVSLGANLFLFQAPEFTYYLKATAIKKYDVTGTFISENSMPFVFGTLILTVFCLFSIVLFKNLKRQLSLARFTALLYFIFLSIIGMCYFLGAFLSKEENEVTATPKFGFYALLIGFILVLLACNGIKKDKKLIESVDRIR